nr:DNA polymerase/3'-5' exonuclease PolX [Anaerolineae bacterium]
MPKLTNQEIAGIFARVADMLEIKGESIHRVLAYRRASETIAELPRDLSAVCEENKLTDLPHIGQTLAEKIEELLTTGELTFYKRLAAEVPPGVVDMLAISGMGPKRAALFWKELGLTGVGELEKAAQEGRLRTLPGMGAKSEAKILEGIQALARRTDRLPLDRALPAAMQILERLMMLPETLQGDVAGSLRRRRDTIGDIDILVTSQMPAPIMEAFNNLPEVARLLVSGDTKSSVELHTGQQVDLRILPPERYGTLLSYFTGSKEHNVRLRELALKKGLSLSENAFTVVETAEEILCATEEAVYNRLGLPWIPPELRENRGEIEAAQEGSLPDLIEMGDIRGDLQMHTTWSDGKASVIDMAQAALTLGREYILITDHSYGLGIVQGLKPDDIARQRAEIDGANEKLHGQIIILQGIEVEIKADGSLDFDDDILAQFDIVLASMHTGLQQPREQVTARLIQAIRHPRVSIIGHPRGRLIPDREPAALDMDVVLSEAAHHDVAMEINANPRRLDLNDHYARRAVELGVKLAISTDAHSPEQLSMMHYGVSTARRGWIEAKHVINTWPRDKLLTWAKEREI